MAVDFTKFDKSMDIEGLKKDIEEANNGGEEFKEVPHDNYEVKITKLELTTSKSKGDPMVSCWMKIIEGEYEGSLIFMNQVVTQGFQVHIANKFLRSLVEGMGIEIKFDSYSQYAELLLDVSEAIDGKREYLMKYGENKGFNTFEILAAYDLD